MKPIDRINPTAPINRVRHVDDQRRQHDSEKARQQNPESKQRPGQDPDGTTHIIDELA